MVIDCHGHYTTAPASLADWREGQVSAWQDGKVFDVPPPIITDEQIQGTIEDNQLLLMNDRGIDLTIFSPRASFMAHHLGDFQVSSDWARICNDLCARVRDLYPSRFAFAAMLPQSPEVDPETSVPEIERAVEELGAVAVNLNPDPSGGRWSSPPLTHRSWYPLYEALIELDIPAMIHVSTSCTPAVHTTGAHYLNGDTTVFMQLLQGDLFADFPTLRFVIPHGGGAVPYHWGRFRGLGINLGRDDLGSHLLENIFFDTCVYHQPGIDLLTAIIPDQNILFASEMVGAVRAIDPASGFYFDDTRRYIDACLLSDEQRQRIFETNVRTVYPRLDEVLVAQGF